MNYLELCKDFKSLINKYEFLKEIDINSLIWEIYFLRDSFNLFFEKKSCYPKYKTKGNNQSYKIDCMNNKLKVNLLNSIIKVPILGNIKFCNCKYKEMLKGEIVNANILKIDNKYYINIIIKSDVNNDEILEKYNRRMRIYYKKLVRQVNFSSNYFKTTAKILSLQHKIDCYKNSNC